MRRYFIAPQDGSGQPKGENSPNTSSHQTSSSWIAYIIPFEDKQTFTPSSIASYPEPDKDSAQPALPNYDVGVLGPQDVMKTVAGGVIFSDSVMSWNITSSKDVPVGTLTMNLPVTAEEPLELVRPGDWIMFWVFNSKDDHDRILQAILDSGGSKRANDFDSGLKFIGKIHGLRRLRSVTGSGAVSTSFSVSCQSFSETANVFPLTPALLTQVQDSGYAAIVQDFFRLVDYAIEKNVETTGVSIQELQNRLLDTVFGPGPGYSQMNASDRSGTNSLVQGLNPKKPCLVPAEVGRLLGVSTKTSTGQLYFSDILSREIGVESIANDLIGDQTKDAMLPFLEPISFRVFPNEMVLLNGSAWNIITEHSGEPVNEAFTAIKYTAPDGYERGIYPTIRIRQIPFSSKELSQSIRGTADDMKLSLFSDAPRWVIDKGLVYSEETGYSDFTRSNYISVHGHHPNVSGRDELNFQANVIDKNPPVIDVSDIMRNGVRQRIKSMNMYFDKEQKPFSKLIADAYMGLHLKKDGRLIAAGIQEPIQPGDNIEYDGYIYHIESVNMSGSIAPGSGIKSFETHLDISRGVPVTVSVQVGQIKIKPKSKWDLPWTTDEPIS